MICVIRMLLILALGSSVQLWHCLSEGLALCHDFQVVASFLGKPVENGLGAMWGDLIFE